MKSFVLFFLFQFMFLSVSAQDEFLPSSHEISFSWDFKGDVISRSMGYRYMFCKYVGVGCDIGFWREMEAGTMISKDFWKDDNGLFRLFVMPNIKICSPHFIKTERVKINAFVENCIMFNRKFTKTIKAYNEDFSESLDCTYTSKVYSYQMFCGIGFKFSEKGDIGFGYSFSTLEYSKKTDFYNKQNPLISENMSGFCLVLNIEF